MPALIIGSGVISNNLARFLSKRGVVVKQVGSREVAAGASFQADDGFDLIIFSGFLCRKISNSLSSLDYNLGLAKNVLRVIDQLHPKRVIFLSTIDIHGNKSKKGGLATPCYDINCDIELNDYYSLAKYTVECMLNQELSKRGAGLLIVRCPGIYGGLYDNSLVFNWFIQALECGVISVNSSSEISRTFLYWEDLALLCEKFVKTESVIENKVCILGSSESRTLVSIAQPIAELTGAKLLAYYEESGRADSICINDGGFFADLSLSYTPFDIALNKFWVLLKNKK